MRTPRNKLTEKQKRVIRENPHIQSGKLAKLLSCNVKAVRYYRQSSWSYSGVGIPFMCFDCSGKPHWSIVYKRVRIAKRSLLSDAINIVDHLIWCIESKMFNQPRVEHPYFVNLKFGDY